MPVCSLFFRPQNPLPAHVSETFWPQAGVDPRPNRPSPALEHPPTRVRNEESRRSENGLSNRRHQSSVDCDPTIGAGGKARARIIYQLDAAGRYERPKQSGAPTRAEAGNLA